MLNRFFVFVFLSISFFSFTLASANAEEDLLMRFKKPMPKEIKKMDEKEFLAKTSVFEQRPFGNDDFAFSVRLPKEWQKEAEKASSNFQISEKLTSKIAIFYGKPTITGQERLEIKAQRLSFDMRAEEWFLQHLMTTGNTTEGYIYHDKTRVEALMLVMEEDISYVLRTVAQINGEYVFLLEYYIPVDMWDQYAGQQERVVQSFKMLNPVVRSVVKTEQYQILDLCRVDFPAYWEEKPDSLTNVERLGVKFFSYVALSEKDKRKVKPKINGKIEVLLIASWSTPSLIEEIEQYKKQSESNNLLIGKKIENIDDIIYNKNVTYGVTEAYKIISNDNSKNYEYWITVLIAGNYYYIVSLTSPSREDDYKTWVKNTQSYRILIKNIAPILKANAVKKDNTENTEIQAGQSPEQEKGNTIESQKK